MSKFFLGAAAVLAMAGTAFATSYRSSLANGVWSDVNSWEYFNGSSWQDIKTAGVPVPSTGDTVTIRASYSIEVAANVTTAHVLIESGAMLTIDSGITLTVSVGGDGLNGILNLQGGTYVLSGSNTIGTSTTFEVTGSGGTITLNNANGIRLTQTSSVFWASGSVTLNGAGSLSGDSSLASVKIGPPSGSATVAFTNEAVITGALIIKKYNASFGTANFANNASGFVVADGNYGTQLAMDSSLDGLTSRTNDSSGVGNAQWEVLNVGRLLFDKAPSAGRYFYVDGSSTLRVNVQIASLGLNSTYGTVDGSQSTYFLNNTTLY
jgi:hypothetical protein